MSMALITRAIHIMVMTTGPFSMGRIGNTIEVAAIRGMCSMAQTGCMGGVAVIRVVAIPAVALAVVGIVDRVNK
jgi:hypothetical protein